MMGSLWRVLTRRKHLGPADLQASKLARVLGTLDLTALGVGSTLGVGVYVLAGDVAKNMAGPAVVLSFLLAAIASMFAGLCYAEFGARIPRAGSAYTYSYVSMGEFIAFIIGWNLILEYVIGSASVVRGLSMYLDSMMNDTMKDAFTSFAPINVPFLSPYFDLFAFVTSLVLAVILAIGVKESSLMNSLFTLVNIAVILFVIIVGSVKADPANWKIRPRDIPANANGGEGGFLPFGISGIIKGTATCFYGFVGFDCIATTGEEVKKPQRAIPVAIITSLTIVFLSYFGVSTVLTMILPYYEQNEDAPIPHVFMAVGWPVAKWIVAVGGVFGLCASLFGSMFPLPRIIYAMATDGLLFRVLGVVSSRLHTPLVATLVAGVLTGVMAGLFELSHLVNMMSIGTLLAYTIVAACVLLLRYSGGMSEDGYMLLVTYCDRLIADEDCHPSDAITYTDNDNDDDGENLLASGFVKSDVTKDQGNTLSTVAMQLLNIRRVRSPTSLTSNIVVTEVSLFCVMCVVTSQSIIQLMDYLTAGNAAAVSLVAIEVLIMLTMVVSITTQPMSQRHLSFKLLLCQQVPLVPFLPALSIFINVYLMMMLDALTWIRFGVWMAIGVVFYLVYGSWKSEEKDSGKHGTSECPKPAAGYANGGYVSSETHCDPEATKEVSGENDSSAENDRKAALTSRSDSNHVATSSTDMLIKENNLESPPVNETIPGTPEKYESDVSFVNESKRNVKQNVRVFGGDSIRSYVSVRDASVNSVKGNGAVVCPSAYVPSEFAFTDKSNSELIPLRNTQSSDESNITVIPGLLVSQGENNKSNEEKNLYPSIIVLPFGPESKGEDQSLNETSDHDNSGDSPDSEDYCTPEGEDLDESVEETSVHTFESYQLGETAEHEPGKNNTEDSKLSPSEGLEVQESEVIMKNKTHTDEDVKVRNNKSPITPQKDFETPESSDMSMATSLKVSEVGKSSNSPLSFTEQLNTLLRKQHSKTRRIQVNNDSKVGTQHTNTEPNYLGQNLHEKLKRTPSIDTRNIENPLTIKDRLEMLLSQRLVGTVSQRDSDSGHKRSAIVPPVKSHGDSVKDVGVEIEAKPEISLSQKESNENFERANLARALDNSQPLTEPYTKDELKAKLENIFSRKQRPSVKTRSENTNSDITINNDVEAAGKHKLLMEEFISTVQQKGTNPNTNETEGNANLINTSPTRPQPNVSEKKDFPVDKNSADDDLEDSDNSEIFFDALNKTDFDHSEER